MRLARLGDEPTSSIVLDHEGCNILFDCPAVPTLVDCSPANLQQQGQQQQQQQQQQQDQQQQLSLQLISPDYAASLTNLQLHAILITSAWGLLGLAHLQQQLQAQGHDLPVHTYCTEPCLHFFQQTAQELLDTHRALQLQQQQQQQQRQQAKPVQAQGATQQQQGASVLAPLFSSDQLQSVLDAVQIVRFGQRVLLPGCFGVTAEARPSGSGIGSCLWLMTCGDQRYTYLSSACLCLGPSAPLYKPALRDLDVLLLGPSCVRQQAKQQLPSAQQQQLQQRSTPAVQPAAVLATAVSAVAAAVAEGGRVLVPVAPGEGTMLQLLEHLPAALTTALTAAAAGSPKLVYMSSAAADALATANSCCEYLEQHRMQQVLAAGTPPFPHEELIKSGRLLLPSPAHSGNSGNINSSSHGVVERTAAAAAADLSQMEVDPVGQDGDAGWGPLVQQVLSMGPCVVFVPLWSFAAGPGAHLAKNWCRSPANLLLLLPDTASASTHWLKQCSQARLIPPQQQWQWQIVQSDSLRLHQSLRPAVGGGVSGSSDQAIASASRAASLQWPPQARLTARELLGALSGNEQGDRSGSFGSSQARVCQVVGCQRDIDLLDSQGNQQSSTPAGTLQLVCLPAATPNSSLSSQTPAPTSHRHTINGVTSISSSGRLAWRQLDLPAPLTQASLSAELADRLQLQRLRVVKQAQMPAASATEGAAEAAGAHAGSAVEQVDEVSVARVQALLTHKSGGWRLDPLPTGPRPEAVSAILAQQQQQQQELLWGSINVQQLLTDLQAAGFAAHLIPQPAAVDVTVIAVNSGEAGIRLSPDETEVACDIASMRQLLLQCLLSQLHKVQ